MKRWIWLALAGGIVVLGAGSFVVYGSDENRLARACTERSGTPLMSFTPKQPLLGWQFGRQTRVSPDTPAIASLESFVSQNQSLWADVLNAGGEMQKELGGDVGDRDLGWLKLRAELNKTNASLISVSAQLDLAQGTDSRLHVAEETLTFRDTSIDMVAVRRIGELTQANDTLFPTVKVSVEVTCYSAFGTDGQELAAVFPSSWTVQKFACSNSDRCIPWDQVVGSTRTLEAPASSVGAGG
ncbi:hypothetical protein [Devosia sp.]|uniref:hypothetical protein n=1 Tax=Devosia sp. TaxID=1871048 RepID=UPI003F711D43